MLKETFIASLPLAAVIVAVCCFIAPLPVKSDYIKLILGYAGVVIGQSVFLVGLEVSILPIGKAVGESLVKLKKLVFILFFGFLFGFLAEAAEPALRVFAEQTSNTMDNLISVNILVYVMAAGIGIFVGLAMFRILKDINIKIVFAVLYAVVFFVIIFTPPEFIGIAFDGSGATTGDISVPFMLALGFGVSATISKHKTNEDTFGIIGMASVGPILAVFIFGIIFKAQNKGIVPEGTYNPEITGDFLHMAVDYLAEVSLALIPILLVFLPFQIFLIKLFKKDFIKILLGTIPVFIGLFIFLICVNYGFAFAGKYIGEVFLDPGRPDWFKWLLLVIGFILGGAITLSEPAVTVLGRQLEEITNGHIKQMTIRLTLAVGIGFAAVLAVVKILTQINILYFLVPLYAAALIMMKFSSKLFVGLAFDSGGVSGGALTSAFLTPLTLGIAQAVASAADKNAQSILLNGFGIIAFISVTPLIAVQALGLVYESHYKQMQKYTEEHELEDLQELLPHEKQTQEE